MDRTNFVLALSLASTIFVFTRSYSLNALTPWTYASLIAASVAVAWLWYIYIERPARRSTATAPFSLSVALGASSLLAFSAVSIAGLGLPFRYTTEQLAILKADPARGIAVRDGRSCRRPIADACTIGDSTHKLTFAVLGDSHAEALTNAISTQLAKRQLSCGSALSGRAVQDTHWINDPTYRHRPSRRFWRRDHSQSHF